MNVSETLLMSSVKLGEGLHKQPPSRRSSQVTRADDFVPSKPLTTREALMRLHDDLKQEVNKMRVRCS